MEIARPADLDELFMFLYSEPHPHLLLLTVRELADRLENGLFVLVRDLSVQQSPIVGACHLADCGGGEWELTGALVLEAHQHQGLASFMARVAISLAFLGNLMNPEGELIGHVLVSNPDPRGLLERLGFECVQQDRTYSPASLKGIAHMASEDGLVHADLFQMSVDGSWKVVEQLEESWGHLVDGGLISVRIPTLTRHVLREALASR